MKHTLSEHSLIWCRESHMVGKPFSLRHFLVTERFPEPFPSDPRTSLGELTNEEHHLPNPTSFPWRTRPGQQQGGGGLHAGVLLVFDLREAVQGEAEPVLDVCKRWRRASLAAMAEAGGEREREGADRGEGQHTVCVRSVEAAALARLWGRRGRWDRDGVEDDYRDLIPVGEGGFRGWLAPYLIIKYPILGGVKPNICNGL
jgi:hypothetical protein